MQRRHAYDNNGRPQSTRLDATSGSALVAASAVSYDTNGRVDSQTYPTGLKLTYAYNAQGYLASASTATAFTVSGKTIAANTVLWQAQSVNAWGRAETESMPSTDSANPLRNWASFEPATGRLASQKSGTNQTTPAGVNLSYTWNSRNLLTARADLIGFNNVATNDSFVHDDLGRLTQYQVSGHNGTQTVSRTVNLSYNAAGMLLNKSDVGSYSYIGSPLGQVHALQSITSTGDQQYNASFSYDRSGNLVTQGGNGAKNGATYVQPKYTAIGYTSFNMVASINSDAGSSGTSWRPYYTYQYDDNHQRLQETRKRDGVIRTTWYLHPDNQGGLGFEREQGAANANRHYLSAAGQVFAVLVTSDALPAIGNSLAPPSSGVTVTAVKLEYWHRDHLGTLVATSNQVGANTGRFAYDPFGKRRQLSTSYDPFGSIVVDWSTGPDRGFTGHEHLDDVGIVNMNGRVFDPLVARFMQADPVIQAPGNLQNFDRYGYCLNGPLGCTDPSGFNWMKDLRWVDPLGYRVMSATARNPTGRIILGLANAYGATWCGPFYAACLGAGQAAISGYAGESFGASVKAGLISGATAYAMNAVGDMTTTSGYMDPDGFWVRSTVNGPANILGHAVVGCASAAAGGGGCRSGALSGAFGAAYSNYGGYSDQVVIATMQHAMVGGIASVLGGGKFANGAMTAAYGYLFNHMLHKGALADLFGMSRGHHSFAKQWAWEYRELISEDALAVLGGSTIGGNVVWKGDHPNKWGAEHKAYNDVGGRKIVDDFFAEKGVTSTNQLDVKQSYELLDRLNRHEFNVKMQDYVDFQRANGRVNMNRVIRPRGGSGQPGG